MTRRVVFVFLHSQSFWSIPGRNNNQLQIVTLNSIIKIQNNIKESRLCRSLITMICTSSGHHMRNTA